jgi:hypothetical protein
VAGTRHIVGRVWLALVIKHYLACRDGNEERRAKLFDLLDGLYDEFPGAIGAEIEIYTQNEKES